MRVFLSYNHADKNFAKQLASELSRQGCDVWDPSDQLFPGDNWPLKIGEALQQSQAMVVLLSPDSMKSEWVRREIEYAIGARNYEGRVFPVLVRPTAEIPWILRKYAILRANKTPAQISEHIASALVPYPHLRAKLSKRKRSA
jgi:TIR domain-containing protein